MNTLKSLDKADNPIDGGDVSQDLPMEKDSSLMSEPSSITSSALIKEGDKSKVYDDVIGRIDKHVEDSGIDNKKTAIANMAPGSIDQHFNSGIQSLDWYQDENTEKFEQIMKVSIALICFGDEKWANSEIKKYVQKLAGRDVSGLSYSQFVDYFIRFVDKDMRIGNPDKPELLKLSPKNVKALRKKKKHEVINELPHLLFLLFSALRDGDVMISQGKVTEIVKDVLYQEQKKQFEMQQQQLANMQKAFSISVAHLQHLSQNEQEETQLEFIEAGLDPQLLEQQSLADDEESTNPPFNSNADLMTPDTDSDGINNTDKVTMGTGPVSTDADGEETTQDNVNVLKEDDETVPISEESEPQGDESKLTSEGVTESPVEPRQEKSNIIKKFWSLGEGNNILSTKRLTVSAITAVLSFSGSTYFFERYPISYFQKQAAQTAPKVHKNQGRNRGSKYNERNAAGSSESNPILSPEVKKGISDSLNIQKQPSQNQNNGDKGTLGDLQQMLNQHK